MSLVKKTNDDQLQLELKRNDTKPKRKINVLDEDTYIQKLETIIEKSFFPDLERLKIQQAYNEALKTKDFTTLQELYEKYNKLLSSSRSIKQSANATPSFFDTPANKGSATPYANEEPPNINIEKTKIETVVESLDSFLAKNTSEDNKSFETLIEEAEIKQKSRIHQSWLFEKEKLHQLKSEQSLMLEGPKINDEITRSLDTWKYTTKNTLMYIPEGTPLTPEEELAQSKSQRIINHSNTRLSKEALNRLNSMVKVSTPCTPKPTNPLTNPIVKLDVDGKETKPKETPKIRGYSLVEPSPSPMPGRSAGDESPMMFWGEIESTPMRLDSSQTPYTPRLSGGPEFKIPDIPEREKVALKLEERMSAEKRKKKQEALKQVQRSIASPSRSLLSSPSMSDRINNMSPAAQKLLSQKKRNNSILSSPIQSPLIKSPYSGIVSPRIKTPDSRQINELKTSLKRPADSSITDNLLKLPKSN